MADGEVAPYTCSMYRYVHSIRRLNSCKGVWLRSKLQHQACLAPAPITVRMFATLHLPALSHSMHHPRRLPQPVRDTDAIYMKFCSWKTWELWRQTLLNFYSEITTKQDHIRNSDPESALLAEPNFWTLRYCHRKSNFLTWVLKCVQSKRLVLQHYW